MIRAAFLFLIIFAGSGSASDCRQDRVQVRGTWGEAHFNVELASDEAARAQGLMNRDSLSTSAGMLFVYGREQRVGFWMRNTRIQLDMIFADQSGRVVNIHHRAKPMDETVIKAGLPVQFVLEINGGLAEAMGIDLGSELRHPAISEEFAAWPC